MVDVFHPNSTVGAICVGSPACVIQVFPCRQYVLLHEPNKEFNLVRAPQFLNSTKVVMLGRVVIHV